MDDTGRIEGSVTGGCVEGALVEVASEVFDGSSARVVEYGISDSEAGDVGLTCGGTVRLFVHEVVEQAREPLEAVVTALKAQRSVALVTLLDGEHAGAKLAVEPERTVGWLGIKQLEHALRRDALGCLDQGLTTVRSYSASGEVMGAGLRVYIQGFASPPEMVIFGAIDFSAAIARLAREIGYRVTICDARARFISSPRFASVATTVLDWPDRYLAGRRLGPRDVVLVFTHDPKFDEPALVAALASDAGYVGALGSRRTHRERLARLQERGVEKTQLARIASPCGLDIGGRTPAETAVSILAEILANRAGRTGHHLAETDEPIHSRYEATT